MTRESTDVPNRCILPLLHEVAVEDAPDEVPEPDTELRLEVARQVAELSGGITGNPTAMSAQHQTHKLSNKQGGDQ